MYRCSKTFKCKIHYVESKKLNLLPGFFPSFRIHIGYIIKQIVTANFRELVQIIFPSGISCTMTCSLGLRPREHVIVQDIPSGKIICTNTLNGSHYLYNISPISLSFQYFTHVHMYPYVNA